jgi:hypothetical protein
LYKESKRTPSDAKRTPSGGLDAVPNLTVPNLTIPNNKVPEHPTVGEVEAYCLERKNNVNPQKFINFYESKGWMIGKNKMKDWKACVRGWEQSQVVKKDTRRYL